MASILVLIAALVLVSTAMPTVAEAHTGTVFRAVMGYLPAIVPAALGLISMIINAIRRRR